MNCAYHKQIIWFFDEEPTILACPTCERTFHCDDKHCPNCGGELLSFTATLEDYEEHFREEC